LINTIEWTDKKVKIIDQTKLPDGLEYICCQDVNTLREAICSLKVRGAPALGIAAALGLVLGIQNSSADDYPTFKEEMKKVIDLLASSRPTAVNLFHSLKRMADCAEKNKQKKIEEIKDILEEEALKIIEEDKLCNRRI